MFVPHHNHESHEHVGGADVSFGYGDLPTQPTMPTQPSVKPTQPSVKPTQPSVKPTQPSVKPTQPSVKPTQPSVKPTQPSVKPTQPSVKPTQPSVKPTQPSVKPTQPSAAPVKPSVKPTQPSVKPTQPSVKPTQPSAELTKPSVKPTQSSVKPTQPAKTQSFTPNNNSSAYRPSAYNSSAYRPSASSLNESKVAAPVQLNAKVAQASAPAMPMSDGHERKHIRKRDLQRDLDRCKKEALKLGKGSKAARKTAYKNLKKRTAKYMKDLGQFDIWRTWKKQPKNLNKNMKAVPNYKNMSKRAILKDLQNTRKEVNKLEFGGKAHQAKILAEVRKRSARFKKSVDSYKDSASKTKGKGSKKIKRTGHNKSKGKTIDVSSLKKGEKIKVNGRLHYDSNGAKPGKTEHNATMKVSNSAKGGKVKVNKSKNASKKHTTYATIPNAPTANGPQAGLQY